MLCHCEERIELLSVAKVKKSSMSHVCGVVCVRDIEYSLNSRCLIASHCLLKYLLINETK